MAGESPDKSKQQEPSGETAGTHRDPRLGVLREREPADVPSPATGEDGSGGAVDGTPEDEPEGGPRGDGDEARDEVPGTSGGAGEDDEPSADRVDEPDRADQGDERLRAAVAAWMERAPGTSGGGTETGDEPADETGDEPADDSGDEARDETEAVADAAVVRPADQPTSMLRAVTPPQEAESRLPSAPVGDEGEDEGEDEAVAGTDPRRTEVPDSAAEQTPDDAGEAGDTDDAATTGTEDPARAESTADDGESGAETDASGGAVDAAAETEDHPADPADTEDTEDTADAEDTDPEAPDTPEDSADDEDSEAADGRARPAVEDGEAPVEGPGGEKPLDQLTTALAMPRTGESDAEERDEAPDGDGDGDTDALGDQATRMFRAVTPPPSTSPKGSGNGSGSGSGTVDATDQDTGDAGDAGKDTPDKSSGSKSSGAEPSGSKDSGSEPGAGDDTPGAAKPAAAASAEEDSPAESRAVERPAERTSRFVPLPPETPVAGRTVTSGSRTGTTTTPRPPGAPPMPSHRPAAGPLPESERTKKQPLPPQPSEGPSGPLDLLAQLTNTPPPPETPLRVALRRVKIWTPLVVLLLIVFATAQALRPLPEPELALTARATYTFEGDRPSLPWPAEGQAYVEIPGLGSLGSSGEQKPVPIASVAKVMTAYVILRDHPIKPGAKGKTLTVDAKAVSDYRTGKAGRESVVEVTEGQKISEYEALQALMLPSANNIARLLARWDAESEKAFVAKMNDAAKDLGMKNTHYTDPSGLTRSTVSTASDQVKLGKKAMEDPVFREISRQPFYTDSKGNKQNNYNQLIPYTGIGIKTGTSTAAGGNLLFAAEQRVGGTTQLIVGAALGQHRAPIIDTVTAASKLLIQAAQDSLVSHTVVKKGQVVGQVDDGLGGTTPVVATKDVKAVGWPGLEVDLGITDDGKRIPHEAKAGTKVGVLTVGSGPGQVRVPVETAEDFVEPTFGSKLTRIL